MDAESSVSRDPRLLSRAQKPSLPNRSSHTDIPRSYSVSENKNDASGDQFIRGISDLVQAAVFAATTKSEKERVQKKRGTIDDLLRKAKGHTGFPSTVEFFQQARDDEDVDLDRIDQKIKEHESHYQRLESQLKARWLANASSQAPQSEENTKQIQRDIGLAKNNFSNLRKDVQGLVGRNQALENEVKTIQDTLRNRPSEDEVGALQTTVKSQQQSFAWYTNALSIQTKDIKEVMRRIDQLENGVKNNLSEAREELLSPYTALVDELKEKIAGWEQKVKSLWNAHQNPSVLPSQFQKTLDDQQQRLDRLSKSQLIGPEPKLASAVQALENKVNKLVDIRSTSDDMLYAEIEDLKAILKAISQDHQRMSQDMEKLSLANSAPTFESRIEAMTSLIQQMQQGFETIKVALYSLETRYNNLTTEPIVRQMVGVMQEMYPTLDDQVKAKLGQLQDQIRGVSLFQDEMDQLKHVWTQTSRTLAELWGYYRAQSQWLSQEAFSKVQSRLESLIDKSQNADKDQESNKVPDGAFLADLGRERNSFNDRLKSLDDAVKQLGTEFAQLRSDSVDDKSTQLELRIKTLEKSTAEFNSSNDTIKQLSTELTQLKSHNGDEKVIQSLELRIKALEKSTEEFKSLNDTVKQLSANLTEVRTGNDDGTDIQSLELRIETLENSAKDSHQHLLKQFDDLKKTMRPVGPPAEPAAGERYLPLPGGGPGDEVLELGKGKKRRKRRSTSDDDISVWPGTKSPQTVDSATSSISESRKKKKKKKKRTVGSEIPFQID